MTRSAQHSGRYALPILLAVLAGTSCVTNRPHLDPASPSDSTVRVELEPGGSVMVLDLEEYVVGSILAEADIRGLNPETAETVAQVQAILARTYALANQGRHTDEGFDLCSTTHCQVYRPVSMLSNQGASLARSAAQATAGFVVTHGGLPINALFHADCGGGTSDAGVAWGGPTPPYLHAVSDPFCLREEPAGWQFSVTAAELLAALNADPRTRVGADLYAVEPTEEDRAGRVATIVIRGDDSVSTVRGEELRHILTQRFGPRSLRSTRFTVARRDKQFVFEGRGWGHGIGLCQLGAAARAGAGHTPSEIFHHYYPGTALTRYY